MHTRPLEENMVKDHSVDYITFFHASFEQASWSWHYFRRLFISHQSSEALELALRHLEVSFIQISHFVYLPLNDTLGYHFHTQLQKQAHYQLKLHVVRVTDTKQD